MTNKRKAAIGMAALVAAKVGSAMLKKKKTKRRRKAIRAPGTRNQSNAVQNVAVASARVGRGSSIAVMHGNPYAENGRLLVKRREFIGDVSLATGVVWQLQEIATAQGSSGNYLAIQPGNPYAFYWLSRIAQNFSQYRFKKLSFTLETEAATTTGGSITMCFDTDVTNSAPATKVQAMDMQLSVREAPWQNMTLNVVSGGAQRALGRDRFVSANGAANMQDDPKTYFLGNLYIGASGITQSSSAELYVDYEVELWQPLTPNLLGNAQFGKTAALPISMSSTTIPGGTVSNSAIFGTTPVVASAPGGLLTIVGNTAALINPGWYSAQVLVSGSGLSNGSITAVAVGTAQVGNYFPTAGYVQNGGAGIWNFYVQILPGSTGMQGIMFNVASGTVTAASLVLNQVDPSVVLGAA